jgi:hypothetical protein
MMVARETLKMTGEELKMVVRVARKIMEKLITNTR